MPKVTLRIVGVEVPVDSRADDLLRNWGEWVNSAARHHRRRTGSAEGRFRVALPESESGVVRLDAAAAQRIEAVISSPAFPPAAAALLRHHYAFRTSPFIAARKLRIPWGVLPAQTKAAIDLMADRLSAQGSPRP